MRLLLLSPYPDALAPTVRSTGDDIVQTSEAIDTGTLADAAPDLILSYGYRHILGPDIVDRCAGRIINLHVSLLPWNRGSDPNFWSFFDDTPKGVTIHQIDCGIDTGDILAQRELTFAPSETLASSYTGLRAAIERLFSDAWLQLRAGTLPGRPQHGAGSVHRARDKQPFMAGLPLGWETPVAVVEAMGRRHRENSLRQPGAPR